MVELNIKPEYLKILVDIFNMYCPCAEVWAYGSRVRDDYHDGSDLDLTVKNYENSHINLAKLKLAISRSNIPFLVDVTEFNDLPKSFQEEIKKNYVVIYKG